MNTNTPVDFSVYFTKLRDNMENGLDDAFQSVHNVSVEGRLTALHAWFESYAEQKVLGLISVGASTLHSNEHRLLFSVPHLDKDTLEDWWQYALTLQKNLVKPDPHHLFTLISVVLVCRECDPAALRRLRRYASEVNYRAPQSGWSSIRLAVVDASSGKIHANRLGAPLVNLLRPALP